MCDARLKKLEQGDPSDPKIYFNSAMLAMDEKKFDLAEVNFKKAIEVSEHQWMLRNSYIFCLTWHRSTFKSHWGQCTPVTVEK